MENKLKCYIYGAGNEYNKLCSYLHLYPIEILGIVTSAPNRYQYIDGNPCITPDAIKREKMDYIIIAVQKWKEIADILRKMGISDDKLLRSSIFYNPYFDLDEYISLKASNVTILSNFCLGGWIYRELGLKQLSPTINMFCLGMNYINFIQNYTYYLGIDMQILCETDYQYIHGTMGRESFIPKGIIDKKIIWYFNHGKNADFWVQKWNENRQKVNYQNVAVLMTIFSDEEAYEFEKLPIKKKLGIYWKDLGLKSVLCCREWNNGDVQAQYDYNWPIFVNTYMRNLFTGGGICRVDWIKFLNESDDFLRY